MWLVSFLRCFYYFMGGIVEVYWVSVKFGCFCWAWAWLYSTYEMDTGHIAVNSVKLLSDLGSKFCVWFRSKWLERIASSKRSLPCYPDHLTDISLIWRFNRKTPPFIHETSKNLKNHLLWKWWEIVRVISIKWKFNKIIISIKMVMKILFWVMPK